MSNPASSVRTRSPRFPGHSVNDAIEFARRIYDGAHTSQIDSLTAIKLMNFSGKSGASATALGSVRQFGLIEGVGEKTRISNLALKILEPNLPPNEWRRYERRQSNQKFFGKCMIDLTRAFLLRTNQYVLI